MGSITFGNLAGSSTDRAIADSVNASGVVEPNISWINSVRSAGISLAAVLALSWSRNSPSLNMIISLSLLESGSVDISSRSNRLAESIGPATSVFPSCAALMVEKVCPSWRGVGSWVSGKNGENGNFCSAGAVSLSGENGWSGNFGSSRSLSVCKFGSSGAYASGKHHALVYAANTTSRNLSVVMGEWLPDVDNIFESVVGVTATGNLIIIEDSNGRAGDEWKTKAESRLGELAFNGLLIVGGEKVYKGA